MQKDRNWAEVALMVLVVFLLMGVTGYYAFRKGINSARQPVCADFASREDVRAYVADMSQDRFRFDRDRDGEPCESLPYSKK